VGLSPDQLRRIKVFADMDNVQLSSLLAYLEAVDVRKFTTLFEKGAPGDAMYSVLSGEVRAREMNEGKETTLFTLAVGETFGELALLIEGERASDIVANEDSRLLRLPAKAFNQIIREAPALATPLLLALSRTLAHRSRALGDRLTNDLTLAQVAGGIGG
jgi:CRP-like cAMP-binding protein